MNIWKGRQHWFIMRVLRQSTASACLWSRIIFMQSIWIRDSGSERKGSLSFCVMMCSEKCWKKNTQRGDSVSWILRLHMEMERMIRRSKNWSLKYTNIPEVIRMQKNGYMTVQKATGLKILMHWKRQDLSVSSKIRWAVILRMRRIKSGRQWRSVPEKLMDHICMRRRW